MCYNKELCIKLKKKLKLIIKVSSCQQIICVSIDFCKPLEKLLHNKDAEKFYRFCYTNIIIRSNKYLPSICEDMATIIISKVTNRLLLKSNSHNWQRRFNRFR